MCREGQIEEQQGQEQEEQQEKVWKDDQQEQKHQEERCRIDLDTFKMHKLAAKLTYHFCFRYVNATTRNHQPFG